MIRSKLVALGLTCQEDIGNVVETPDLGLHSAICSFTSKGSGSLLFFGFYDTMETYTSILFLNQPGSGDFFGFDDMIVGDRGQVTPDPVPLPAAGWMLLAGIGGLAAARRKKA